MRHFGRSYFRVNFGLLHSSLLYLLNLIKKRLDLISNLAVLFLQPLVLLNKSIIFRLQLFVQKLVVFTLVLGLLERLERCFKLLAKLLIQGFPLVRQILQVLALGCLRLQLVEQGRVRQPGALLFLKQLLQVLALSPQALVLLAVDLF